MLTDDMKLISVDDHLIEQPRAWEDRLPAAFRETGPRVVELPDGTEEWRFAGEYAGPSGLAASVGTDFQKRNRDPKRYEDMLPGCWQPAARLGDMDQDGVWAQLLFPTLPGFGGRRFIQCEDKALALACVKAYNDYVVEEWSATSPERLLAMAILPLWDPLESAKEIRRAASMGHRAFAIPDSPAHVGLPSFWEPEAWRPVFAAAEEVDLPVCMHFGASGVVPSLAPDAPQAVKTAVSPALLFHSLAELVMSPALVQHPDLKVVYSESGIGWVPYAMERLDQVWEHYRYYDLKPALNAEARPSELMRAQVHWCFIDDPLGLDLRDRIGVDRIMWESDYPHADSLWPRSRENAARVLKDVPDDVVAAITNENARRVFKLA